MALDLWENTSSHIKHLYITLGIKLLFLSDVRTSDYNMFADER